MHSRFLITLAMVATASTALAFQPTSPIGPQDRAFRRTPVVRAVQAVAPSVVSISTQAIVRRRYSPWDDVFQRSQPRNNGSALRNHSLGSGVIVDAKGYVITNDHVVAQADKIIITLSDGSKYPADVVGTDPENDIAVLRMTRASPFPTAKLALNNDLMLGETTIALGNPFGLQGSVTTGVLSATGRSVHLRNKKVFEDFIQTSAVINPGNSGGPLLNISGDVIGINVAIHNRGPGIGFAIPVNRVRETVHRILDPRVTRKASLGFSVGHAQEKMGVPISAIAKEGPAAECGLKVGDLILRLNGFPVANWIDFHTSVAALKTADPIEISLQRGNKNITCSLALEVLPEVLNQRRLTRLLGFSFSNLSTAQRAKLGYRINGVLVTDVYAGSSAESIGLQAGDLVFSMGGYSVKNAEFAMRIVESFDREKEDVVTLRLIRNGEKFQGALGLTRPE